MSTAVCTSLSARADLVQNIKAWSEAVVFPNATTNMFADENVHGDVRLFSL